MKMSLYSLYPITDRHVSRSQDILTDVRDLCLGGVKILQLREKKFSGLEFFELAQKVKKITDSYGVKLMINDHLDIAQAVNADGVHLGQTDLPLKIARRILGKQKIIGISCESLAQALQAEKDGADYLSVQAIFPTQTKRDVKVQGKKLLQKVLSKIKIPVVAIGGINENNLSEILTLGCRNISMISALLNTADVKTTTQRILARIIN